ncbi:MAG TPA: hypothetical protein VN519_00415 [Bryobacteraceae bacterium]|nr:hypothetical protein [Bryobacteraceae bacterium]
MSISQNSVRIFIAATTIAVALNPIVLPAQYPATASGRPLYPAPGTPAQGKGSGIRTETLLSREAETSGETPIDSAGAVANLAGSQRSGKVQVTVTIDAPRSGDTAISGKYTVTGDLPKSATAKASANDGTQQTVQGPLALNLNTAKKTFSGTFDKALTGDQYVVVAFTDGATNLGGGTIRVQDTVATIALDVPSDGDTAISGSYELSGPAPKTLTGQVRVLAGSKVVQAGTVLSIDPAGHTFKGTLNKAVEEGQTVAIVFMDGTAGVGYTSKAAARGGYDWGRVHFDVTAGAIWARSNGKFGSADPFLALTGEYNIFNSQHLRACAARPDFGAYMNRVGFNRDSRYSEAQAEALQTTLGIDPSAILLCEDTGERNQKAAERNIPPANKGHWLLNTYFTGRLTQVALPSDSAGDSSNSGSNAASTSKAIAHDTSSNSSAGAGSAQTIINSKTGGAVEAGIYIPAYSGSMRWKNNGQDQAIFIAPLFKTGFLLPGDGETIPGTAADNGDAFLFYAGGIRLGHFLLPSDPSNSAPETLSFLDMTWGRWDNFRMQSITPGETFRRPLRFEATGRLKIPATKAYIGFSVNTGSGPDEFQVFVGTHFDIGQVLAKLSGGN